MLQTLKFHKHTTWGVYTSFLFIVDFHYSLFAFSCRLLKMAGNIIAPSLTQIFIKSINTGIFPTEWKLARVTPIFKKVKRDDPNNYRPISVIPTVAKIFDKIIYDQLCDYLNGNNLLTRCQSGFRSLHSKLTALIGTTNSLSVNIDNGFVNGVIFIDLKKAFDTIDHTYYPYTKASEIWRWLE